MPLEAFQKYEELRNKYYEFVLRKADKLSKFISSFIENILIFHYLLNV